ncbi:hypothetical protein SK854_06290 [Lentzea sp. BCCO 10_0061]|uniref:Secreted protein n=1 Tax=Lentzea sokolovensis TaxID=3095429 RepID=A0ABU4USL6_9PSEU|nr:hypothetical protein [Lentzea sp. BCCO 10_0061]MDX8141710.1 hypothetical protein [Lentzea sp. BCCO 10_0061]
MKPSHLELSRAAAIGAAVLLGLGGVAVTPSAAFASPLDSCSVTAYLPQKSGNTITFSAVAACSGHNAVHQYAISRYRNGQYQGHKSIRCVDTIACYGSTTQSDVDGNQEWCTVIEGSSYIQGHGGRSLAAKKCETNSW